MADTSSYTPPKVWQWNTESGGTWAKINRPIAGATHEQELPVGRHPLQLYSLATPNGVKVTIMLEELLALGKRDADYDAFLIKIGDGEQFGSGFVALNPNSKIPALLDRSTSPPTRVFESGAILLYLAEKFDAFVPQEPSERAECLEPQSSEKKKSPNCCLMPQERHEICGVLFQLVIRSIDQIWCEVWTSIGPLPPQWEHRPRCSSWAARISASCGTPSTAIASAS